MVRVTDAQYVHGYRIEVAFNDGARGIVDLEDAVLHDHRVVFSDLRDLAAFQKFKVDMDTIVWENGVDLAPEYLYGLATQGSSVSERAPG